MFNYSEEKGRRIQQFAQALEPMAHRTVNIAKGCCYLVLSEDDDCDDGSLSLEESRVREKVHSDGIGESLDSNLDHWPEIEGWSNEGWRDEGSRGDKIPRRFVQFVFYEQHFEMDLPRPMLWPSEARKILASRTGFYFLRDRQRRRADPHDAKYYDPLRKAYVHGDCYTAAEDIAYMFFDLWHFPVESKFYLSSFGKNHSWASSRPIE